MLDINILKTRIKQLCKETGISQKHLTDSIGRKNTYLNDIWNGKCAIKPEDLAAFASILGTTPAYLAGETDDPSRAGEEAELTSEDEEMLTLFRTLSPENKEILKKLIGQMSKSNE